MSCLRAVSTRDSRDKPFNPWPSFKPLSVAELWANVHFGRRPSSESADEEGSASASAPTRRLPELASDHIDFSGCTAERAMWLGHASVFVQIPRRGTRKRPFGVLFDPIASERCSPISFLGPKRRTPFPTTMQEMGPIDLVVLSHDHHDHCDPRTIRQIETCNEGKTLYAVPTGMERVLEKIGIPESRIVSMRWWEELVIDQDCQVKSRQRLSEPSGRPACRSGTTSKADPSTAPEVEGCHLPTLSFDRDATNDLAIELVEVDENGEVMDKKLDRGSQHEESGPSSLNKGEIKIACLPSQHNSLRNKTHWSSWLIQSGTGDKDWTFYFGGDTGYRSRPDGPTCPIFSQIRERYGPPDLSALPMSVGACLPYVEKLTGGLVRISEDVARPFHATPEDAARMHEELGSKRSFGIHWGTWSTDEGAWRSVLYLQTAIRRLWRGASGESTFNICKIGEWL